MASQVSTTVGGWMMNDQGPHLLLVHGWGFGPGLWRPFRRVIEDGGLACRVVDLGFFGSGGVDPLAEGDGPVVMVGHSLGFLWLLERLREPSVRERCRGLVSIGGFSRFVRGDDFEAGVDPRLLQRMQKKWPRDPQAVLNDFRRRGGQLPPVAAVTDNNRNDEALLQGLQWLETWDHRPTLAAWEGPLLALAARDDAIVPPAMSEACFGAAPTVHWFETGGHLLPLSEPDRCAERVRAFLAAGPGVER